MAGPESVNSGEASMSEVIHSLSAELSAPKAPYTYHALAHSEIRVLVLYPGEVSDPVRCHLMHVSLTLNPKYETISYTWGDPIQKHEIECSKQTLYVTANLHLALQHIRHPTTERAIWADAVCIDQENLEERSRQVVMMGDIYAQAEQVLVWLGIETEDVRESIEKIEWLNQYFLEHEEGYPNQPGRWDTNPDGHSPDFLDLLNSGSVWKKPVAALVKRPWFLRRWVIQEVAKSPRATVVCGKKTIPWILLADVIWSLHKAGMLSSLADLGEFWSVADGTQSIIVIELIRRDVLKENGSKLLELVISVRRYKCLDKRDVIFSALGVVKDLRTYNGIPPPGNNTTTNDSYLQRKVSPDYESTVEEVYTNFVVTIISKKKSLLPLSAPYIKPSSPALNLPSWVPDFSDLSNGNPLMHLRNESALPYHASGSTTLRFSFSNNNHTLHLHGKIVDVIKTTTPAHEEIVLPPVVIENGGEPLSEDQKGRKIMGIWCENAWKLASSASSSSQDENVTLSPERTNELIRTFVCNLTASGDIPPPDFIDHFQQYLDVLKDSKVGIDKHRTGENGEDNIQGLIDRILLVESAVALRVLGWGFCCTEGGRLGRVLGGVREGDLVVVVYGAEVPFILRRQEAEGGFEFLGTSYMHGLMDGEALEMEGLKEQEFAIN